MVPKVVILGAGYAGVSAARRLARADTAVTIVNPRPEFVERIRLHQFVVGNHRAVHSLQSVLPGSAALHRGKLPVTKMRRGGSTSVTLAASNCRLHLFTHRVNRYQRSEYALGAYGGTCR